MLLRSALLGGLGLALAMTVAPVQAGAQGSDALDRLMQMQGAAAEGVGCPSRGQVFADEVLRLHTELMVTGILCGSAYGRPDLENDYRLFTERHVDAILDAEGRLSREPIVNGDGIDDIDDYRTLLANEEAGRVREMSPSVYCQARQSRFNSLSGASPSAFLAYAEDRTGRRMARQMSRC